MNKIFFRSIVLTLVTSVLLWHSPICSRNRSGDRSEGPTSEMTAFNTRPNKLDSSNERAFLPIPKSRLEKDIVTQSEEKNETKSQQPTDLVSITKEPRLEDNVIFFQETGLASWYGTEFDGKITASGELCNTNEMTASHKSLPFGTLVEVTNNLTGESVTVRINDRGPFVRGRIINLSYSAAKKINFVEKGVAEVSIKTLSKDN